MVCFASDDHQLKRWGWGVGGGGQLHNQWTTSTRPGLHMALEDGDNDWRGQKEESVLLRRAYFQLYVLRFIYSVISVTVEMAV